MRTYRAALFDLDGTLLDTWPDILRCLRIIEHKYVGPLSNNCDYVRKYISAGTEAMLKIALEIEKVPPQIIAEIEKIYTDLPSETHESCLFDGIEKTIEFLNLKKIPWGIVTNKPKMMTYSLFKSFPKLYPPSGCIICPEDTNGKKKPDPTPILIACNILNLLPTECIYVGDSIHDISAGNLAGATTIGALFGYIPQDQNPEIEWKAHFYVKNANALFEILEKLMMKIDEPIFNVNKRRKEQPHNHWCYTIKNFAASLIS